MKKTMKRVLSIMLALVMALGLSPAMAGGTVKAASFPLLKNGQTKTVKISPSKISESYTVDISKPSKVTLDVYTDLTGGAKVDFKKGVLFEQVDSRKIDNGKEVKIVAFCPKDEYVLDVSRLAAGESGDIRIKCSIDTLDTAHDIEPNDVPANATEITTGRFTGSFLYGDEQDMYKFEMKEAGLFNFSIKALEGRNMTLSIGDLDASGDFEPRTLENGKTYKEVSVESGLSDKETININMGAGTHYIAVKSSEMGSYEFTSDYIKVPVEKIVLKKKNLTIKVGSKAKLYKSISPKGSNGGVEYIFSDDSKVDVLNMKTGWIKAVKVGKTKLTIKYGDGKSVSCNIVVKPKKK